MASVPAWLWIAAGWCAIVVGGWLALTGRRVLRARTARRCGRCGYGMPDVQQVKCPECGREAKSERELVRVPALWRWRLAGVALLAIGWLGTVTPAMVRHGWPGAIPDWLIARVSPVMRSEYGRGQLRKQARPFPPGPEVEEKIAMWEWAIESGNVLSRDPLPTIKPAPAVYPISDQAGDAVFEEAWRRLRAGELRGAAGARYLGRWYAAVAAEPEFAGALPAHWPADRGYADCPSLLLGYIFDPGAAKRRAQELLLSMFWWPETPRLPGDKGAFAGWKVDCSRPSGSFMRRVSTEAIDDTVRLAIDPVLKVRSDGVFVQLNDRSGAGVWNAIPYFIHYTISVRMDGQTLGTEKLCASRTPTSAVHLVGFGTKWAEGAQQRMRERPEAVELVIAGDPVAAVEEYVGGAYGFEPIAWDGKIVVRPRVERDPGQ